MIKRRASIILLLSLVAGSCGGGDTGGAGGGSCDLTSALKETGQLTVATSDAGTPPWVLDNDPTSGQGFESAVVYALADELGLDSVNWVTVSRQDATAPGGKSYDLAIQQLPITAEADEAVDFSSAYYRVQQVIVGSPDGRIASAERMTDLRTAQLGVMSGTDSLEYVETEVAPDRAPFVFDDTAAAKAAFDTGQVDGIVTGLPAAYAMIATDIPEAAIVVVFPRVAEDAAQYGMAFEESSSLVPCVNDALEALHNEGELGELEDQWLHGQGRIPTLVP